MLLGQSPATHLQNNVITLFNPRNKKTLRRLTADQVSGLTKQFISEIQAKIDSLKLTNNADYRELFNGSLQSTDKNDFDFKLAHIGTKSHNCQSISKILNAEDIRLEQGLKKLCEAEISRNPCFIAPIKNCDYRMQLSYLTDFSFVKRRITKAVHQARLEFEAKTKSVGGSSGIDYCSNESITFIRRRDEKNAEFLRRRSILVKQTGHLINLHDLQLKQAERKFNESYYIIKNLESIATDRGLVPHMLTLTAPANFHPNPLKGKSSFDQSSAADSQKYLSHTWSKLRALLSKRETPFSLETCFGVRTAELHKDGCIHWHILMFIDPALISSFQDALDHYFTSRQADVKTIDGVAAATYVLKYIGKTIDPSQLERNDLHDDLADQKRKDEDLSTIADAERVRAGIRVMGVRQMQYYGIGGSLTLFRALNKITDDTASLSGGIREILTDCRMHDRSDGNTKITNFLAFKNFLCKHLGSVRLIREEVVNKHGAATKRIVGIHFIESGVDVFTNDKYEVIINSANNDNSSAPGEKDSYQECQKARAKAEVTVISIYPRRADRLTFKKHDRPTASELLKQAKNLNPKRYSASYVATSITKEPFNPLNNETILNLMSMT